MGIPRAPQQAVQRDHFVARGQLGSAGTGHLLAGGAPARGDDVYR